MIASNKSLSLSKLRSTESKYTKSHLAPSFQISLQKSNISISSGISNNAPSLKERVSKMSSNSQISQSNAQEPPFTKVKSVAREYGNKSK